MTKATLGFHVVLISRIVALRDVGDTPFKLIGPILMACPPHQLVELETNSPHLMTDTDELWKLHLTRDFPLFKLPASTSTSSPPSYRDLYTQAGQEKEQALELASARLREKKMAHADEKGKRKLVFTSTVDHHQAKKKKLGGTGWGGSTWGKPAPKKSIVDKARAQTRKIASVYSTTSTTSPYTLPGPSKPSTSTKPITPDSFFPEPLGAPRHSTPPDPDTTLVTTRTTVVTTTTKVPKSPPANSKHLPDPRSKTASVDSLASAPTRAKAPPIITPASIAAQTATTLDPLSSHRSPTSSRATPAPSSSSLAPIPPGPTAPTTSAKPTTAAKGPNLFMPKPRRPHTALTGSGRPAIANPKLPSLNNTRRKF